MAKKKMPQAFYIYQVDNINGEPIYAVANDLIDIEFDVEEIEKEVGVYTLDRTGTVRMRKEFTPND